MLFLLSGLASAASLDNLEVGGPWGTPTATDATAAWWNPAGLAAGEGTRILVEGAPTFATVTYLRDDPNGGQDTYKLAGVVPFAGIATDLGVDGLGLGLAMGVPTVRGGAEVAQPGTGAYHMMDGESKAIWLMAGGAWQIRDRFSLGATVALVHSNWTANVLSDTMPDLDHALAEEGEESGYTDTMLEDPNYAAELKFGELADTTLSFGAGVQLRPSETVTIGVAYVHGAEVTNRGDLLIETDCPPDSDTIGQFAADSRGLCYADIGAEASVGYALPHRVHAGVAWQPTESLRLEAMGGWVAWSVFSDFDIKVWNTTAESEDAKELLEQEREWARANEDSFWAGLDAKGQLGDRWTLGGRVMIDEAAVPDEALSTNNYDANEVLTTLLAAYRPTDVLQIGVSWTHHFVATREVTTSGFGMTVEGEAPDDRWNYPHANGTYTASIDRLGVAVRTEF